MAYTTVKVAEVANQPAMVGQVRRVFRDLVITSYVNNGEALTPASVGLTKIVGVMNSPVNGFGTQVVYNQTAATVNGILSGFFACFEGAVQTAGAAARTCRIEIVGY